MASLGERTALELRGAVGEASAGPNGSGERCVDGSVEPCVGGAWIFMGIWMGA